MNAFNAAVESCAIQLFPILGDTSCAKRTLCWPVERAFCVSEWSGRHSVITCSASLDASVDMFDSTSCKTTGVPYAIIAAG